MLDLDAIRQKTLKHEMIHLAEGDHYLERETAEAEALKAEARITMDLVGNDCIIIWGMDEGA